MKGYALTPLTLASVLTLFMYVGIFMRIPIIPLYAISLGATEVEVGLIASFFMVVAAILAIPLGSLSDRFGRKRLIVIGLGLSSITSFLLFLSQTPKQIMIIYTFAGLGAAAFAPAMFSFVGDTSASSRMGRAFGWYTSTMQIGMTIGLALGGFIAFYVDYGSTFVFSGVIILAAFILGISKLPAFSIVNSNIKDVKLSLRNLLDNEVVLACWLATFCIAFGYGVFLPFFPLYASAIGLSIFSIGLLFALQSFFNAFARIPAGYISDRLGKRYPFIVIGMLIFAVAIVLLVSASDLHALILIVALIGLTMGIVTMAISTSLAEAVDPRSRGIAMGGFSTTLYGGFAFSSALTGKIISSFSYFHGFLVAGVICAFGAILFTSIYHTKSYVQRDNRR